jgi:uncharacterized protein Yka (UPF0111/DUF47 family)
MEYQEQNNFVDNCDVSKCRLWNDNFKIMKCSGMRKCEGTDCLFKSKALRKVAKKQTEIIQRQTQTILEFKNEIDRLKNSLENTLERSNISYKSRMEMLKTKEELENTIAELTEKLEHKQKYIENVENSNLELNKINSELKFQNYNLLQLINNYPIKYREAIKDIIKEFVFTYKDRQFIQCILNKYMIDLDGVTNDR